MPKILIVSLYYPPAKTYGGPLQSAVGLAREFAREHEVRILTTDADGNTRLPVKACWQEASGGEMVRYCRTTATEFFSIEMIILAWREVAVADVIYVWGIFVWVLPLILVRAKLLGKTVIVSPRGMLFPNATRRKWIRKRLFIKVCELAGLSRAILHVTSETEQSCVKKMFPRNTIVRSRNGIVIPEYCARETVKPYFVFLGRLVPIKRIELMLAAFACLPRNDDMGNAELFLCGTGSEAYIQHLRAKSTMLGIGQAVHFVGFVDGEDKRRILRSALALVLVSESENFGIAVAEALAEGVPVIVTENLPWTEVRERKCGWVVTEDDAGISAAMAAAMRASAKEVRDMGRRGRDWIETEMSWQTAARPLTEHIERLTSGMK